MAQHHSTSTWLASSIKPDRLVSHNRLWLHWKMPARNVNERLQIISFSFPQSDLSDLSESLK